jgi:hypothetical protein
MNYVPPRNGAMMENFQDAGSMDRLRNEAASIPGAAIVEVPSMTTTSATYALRTHSSKFPVSL